MHCCLSSRRHRRSLSEATFVLFDDLKRFQRPGGQNLQETDSTKYSNDKITIKNDLEELDEENENRVEEEDEAFTKTIVDDLISNKSIRRPLCNLNTSKDFINKMKSLEAKAKYCQDQNKINFKKTDRNIRYGDDPPKNNIYRQLRIISKFDS